MLAGARLGDDPRLAHPPRQQHLAQRVVDLVGAGVVQVLALEVDLAPPQCCGEPLREVERRRPAHVLPQVVGCSSDWNSGSSRAWRSFSQSAPPAPASAFPARTARRIRRTGLARPAGWFPCARSSLSSFGKQVKLHQRLRPPPPDPDPNPVRGSRASSYTLGSPALKVVRRARHAWDPAVRPRSLSAGFVQQRRLDHSSASGRRPPEAHRKPLIQ